MKTNLVDKGSASSEKDAVSGDELASLKDRLCTTRTLYGESNVKINHLESQISQLTQERDLLKERFSELQKKENDLYDKYDKQFTRLQQLEAQVKRYEGDLISMSKVLNKPDLANGGFLITRKFLKDKVGEALSAMEALAKRKGEK